MWWFDHADTRALFGDRRRETLTVKDTSHGREDGRRVLRIDPDVDIDFRALPFPDKTFHLVAFDPPHLVRAGAQSWMAAKYGKLGPSWRDDLRVGFTECFRVLVPHGVLVVKWSETQVKVRDVLALTPETPLFGNTSGRKAGTHWIVFMKPNTPTPRRVSCASGAGRRESEDEVTKLQRNLGLVAKVVERSDYIFAKLMAKHVRLAISALRPKTCSGCVHERGCVRDSESALFPCRICPRAYRDRYEPKKARQG
jgi:hypothetical protein